MSLRNILDYNGNIIGELSLPDDATEQQWSNALAPYAVKQPVPPPSVTPRQIRQALVLNGVSLAAIDSALAGLPDPTKTMAQIEWEYSTLVYRSNPLVGQVGQLLGWTSDQIDALFIFANSLPE
jgi:hypothetical protein